MCACGGSICCWIHIFKFLYCNSGPKVLFFIHSLFNFICALIEQAFISVLDFGVISAEKRVNRALDNVYIINYLSIAINHQCSNTLPLPSPLLLFLVFTAVSFKCETIYKLVNLQSTTDTSRKIKNDFLSNFHRLNVEYVVFFSMQTKQYIYFTHASA